MIRDPVFSENEARKESSPAARKEKLPHRAYLRAGKYRLYREMISSAYTNIYGMFRILFLKSGESMVEKGYLKDSKDVFYLTLEEFERLLDSPDEDVIKALQIQIRQVKEEIEKYSDIALPAIIYGEAPPPIATANETVYRGIPVSPGIFEGQIVVVKGYSDFKKPVAGKILVIPFSDVGWTPILSHAGAIVAESGGILSHASIVARELGLPAISSVDHACNLQDGSMARVDANHGILILKD
jgi:pyruvate,water dikinase